MSTRAVYTFKDDHKKFSIYKHHDGYPEGAAQPFHPSTWRYYAADKLKNQNEGLFLYWSMTLWN